MHEVYPEVYPRYWELAISEEWTGSWEQGKNGDFSLDTMEYLSTSYVLILFNNSQIL